MTARSVRTSSVQPVGDVRIIMLRGGTRFLDDEHVAPHVASKSMNQHQVKLRQGPCAQIVCSRLVMFASSFSGVELGSVTTNVSLPMLLQNHRTGTKTNYGKVCTHEQCATAR